MADPSALPALLLLPVAGALVVPLVRPRELARVAAMVVMLGVLLYAALVFAGFSGAGSGFEWRLAWLPALGVDLHFAVNGFNVYLLLLTALLFPVVLACGWNAEESRQGLYLALLLALEAGLLGTFLARNLVILFVLWEAVLIPVLLLIVVYGGPERRRAALTFFLYTMAGSVLFLAAVILLGAESLRQTGRWEFALDSLYRLRLSPGVETFVFVAIALACAVKSPIFPFHSWLPLAYGEASASTTALMAGLMSKMGAFGFVALALPLCPSAAPRYAPVLIGLAVVSIVYGAVLALRQPHYKGLVAYASLSHMGYIVLGVFTFQATGLHGAMLQILSHGLAVAGLFILLGLLEQRCGPEYLRVEALAVRAPRFAVVLMLFVLASLALPLTSGFTAEFMILLGAFTEGLAAFRSGAGSAVLVAAACAATGVVLGATYMLRFARVILYGNVEAVEPRVADLERRELVALAPLLFLILLAGVWPAPLMSKAESAVGALARPATRVAADAGSAVVRPAREASHGN